MRALTSRRRHPFRWVLVLSFLTLLTWPRPAVGQDQRAVLELMLNGVPKGDVLVLLREPDVWVAVGPLATAGLEDFAGTRERHGDEEFVSLQSLSELVAFSVNELDLRLNVTAAPRALGVDVRDLGIGAPANMIFRSSTSAFVNYAVNWSGNGDVSLFTESAARLGGALLHSTVSADRGGATRGLSSVTVDEREAMRRWVVGDSYAYSGPLGGDAWMAGVSVSREFSLDPYYVRHPELSLSTPVALPSTLEVHLNGRIVSQQEVAPGRIDIRNLPLTMGRNDARVVVRDAFGGSRELSTSYYLTTSALARGVHDYQYSVGFRRRALGSTSWDYASPAALARHRVGLTDSVTAGGRVELGAGLFNAGPAINLRLPFGEVEGAAALSRSPSGWGSGVLVGYNYSGRPISGGGSFSLTGHHYTTLGQSALLERPTAEASVFGSAVVNRRLSLTAQHNRSTFRSFTRDRSSLVANVHISRYVELTSSATWGREADEPDRELFAGLTFLFGRSSAAFSTIRNEGATRSMVETQRPLPVGTGYGYQFRAEGGAQDLVSGQGRYQNQYGRYELRRDVIAGEAQTTVSAAGAVVGIGGRIFASRPVYESFAVISVPGVEGVRGFASNQEVGRTARGGQLLVPDLQAYYGNLLSIADTDVPLDYGVAAAGMTLALPYRGGAVATFPVRPVRRVIGRVLVRADGRDLAPAYGELRVTVDGRDEISPVGAGGEFYFENLPAGRFDAAVASRDLSCAFALDIPGSPAPLVDLGTSVCSGVRSLLASTRELEEYAAVAVSTSSGAEALASAAAPVVLPARIVRPGASVPHFPARRPFPIDASADAPGENAAMRGGGEIPGPPDRVANVQRPSPAPRARGAGSAAVHAFERSRETSSVILPAAPLPRAVGEESDACAASHCAEPAGDLAPPAGASESARATRASLVPFIVASLILQLCAGALRRGGRRRPARWCLAASVALLAVALAAMGAGEVIRW